MSSGKFDEIIGSSRPVLVDFSAEWCGPCKMLAPILHEYAGKVGDKLRIIKIDVDRNPEVSQRYQIRGVPTMILFKEGKILWRQSGVMPVHELDRALGPFLG